MMWFFKRPNIDISIGLKNLVQMKMKKASAHIHFQAADFCRCGPKRPESLNLRIWTMDLFTKCPDHCEDKSCVFLCLSFHQYRWWKRERFRCSTAPYALQITLTVSLALKDVRLAAAITLSSTVCIPRIHKERSHFTWFHIQIQCYRKKHQHCFISSPRRLM